MSVDTFLEIEAQKIFSLYNCPNCQFTWQLFQKHIREIIFESYSLTINKFDRTYRLNQEKGIEPKDYKTCLDEEIQSLYAKLEVYLPSKTNKKDNSTDIVPTFMKVFYNIRNSYTDTIKNYFPNKLTKFFKDVDASRFVSFNVGFKPFTLMYKSGSRINEGDQENDDNQNYIDDPELKYQQKVKKKTIQFSITKKIDQIFNIICNKINETIGDHIGLKFFVRRTLGGCEFGICYDFELENNEECSENLLVDKDTLFLFTISVKCKDGAPLLAGILIFCLVYITSIVKTISEYFEFLPEKFTKDLIEQSLKKIVFKILKDKIKDKIEDKINEFLIAKIIDQIDKFMNEDIKQLFKFLTTVFNTREYSKASEQINGLFQFNIKCGQFELNNDDMILPTEKMLKIGVSLILCFSAFMMNFNTYHKKVHYYESKVSKDYEKDVKEKKALNYTQYGTIVPQETIEYP
ncbi:hypothetical protein M9Y10_041904 [Tritrichomonas musculus]|uniref:Uncharacterized protein n=1 Tax=Tritrichomonas musculus TaxID=1915356 RepID=A0ABR2K6A6_9EUKA